jgi:hypothetical protein
LIDAPLEFAPVGAGGGGVEEGGVGEGEGDGEGDGDGIGLGVDVGVDVGVEVGVDVCAVAGSIIA